MAAPFRAKFDRFAQATNGLVAIGFGPVVNVNYLALATGFMYGENWMLCDSVPSTSWAACGAAVTTSWTQSFSTPVTGWTLVAGGP